MAKKEYLGLDVEIILFGSSEISTAYIWHVSGCTLGAVTYWTENELGNPMPLGQCWYDEDDDNLSLDWGSTVYGGINP